MISIKNVICLLGNLHIQSNKDIFIISTPRSGSNWLSEILCSTPFTKGINEPFNLRSPLVQYLIKTDKWDNLYDEQSENLIIEYLQKYSNGHFIYGLKNMPPFNREHSFLSFRIVFKILHACEDKVNILSKEFNTKIIYLIRHPIPVTLSRKVYPRLNVIRKYFNAILTTKQKDFVKKNLDLKDSFKNGIIDWILQNYPILRVKSPPYILITYEQMVFNPKIVLKKIASEYSLDYNSMIKRSSIASNTITMSDSQTKAMFNKPHNYDKEFLLKKWFSRVDETKKQFVNEALDVFKIDIYNAYSQFPEKSYQID